MVETLGKLWAVEWVVKSDDLTVVLLVVELVVEMVDYLVVLKGWSWVC